MADDDYDVEQLNAAFAQLRGVAGAHVMPPGLAAARATVARRKRVRAAAIAAVTLAALVIPVATLARPVPDIARPDLTALPSASWPASPSPSPSPTASPTPSAAPGDGGSAAPAAGGQALAYTAIWYTGPLSGLRVDLPTGHAFTVPVGIRVWSRNSSKVGPVTNAKLTIDLSQIVSKVDVVSLTGPCHVSGVTAQCDFGTLPTGTHLESLTLRARAGAPSGEVGEVGLTASGNENSWHAKQTTGRVSIGNFSQATDYTMRASMNAGKVGDVLTMQATVTNRGPTTGSYYELLPASLSGMEIAGMSANCLPAQLGPGCRLENIAVGASLTVQIQIRITSCAINGYNVGLGVTYLPDDPVYYETSPGNPQYRISGC